MNKNHTVHKKKLSMHLILMNELEPSITSTKVATSLTIQGLKLNIKDKMKRWWLGFRFKGSYSFILATKLKAL